jgi:translation initiation factor 2A
LTSAKLEDGSQHKNLRVFSVSTGDELTSFSQKSQDGWDLQYTISETHAIRLVSQEIQVLNPADWKQGIVNKLKVEGATSVALSPGLTPSLAVFIGEKKVPVLQDMIEATRLTPLRRVHPQKF